MSLRSISRLTFINACSAAVSVVNSVAMAWLFGTSTSAQVYMAAVSLLLIVQKAFMVGQFSDAFLPQYVKIRESEGGVKADRCFSALFNHVVLMLLGSGVILVLVAPAMAGLIAPGFDPAEQRQVGHLLQGLIPVLMMVVAGGHLQIIGNARGWYGRFEFYGLVGNFAGLVNLLLTARFFHVWSLVLSLGVTQVISLVGSWRYLIRNGYRHSWIAHEPGFSVWAVNGRVALTIMYVIATQWYSIVFTAAMTYLPNGALSVYKYAENLYVRTGALFMRPVSVVFFTDASTLAHRDPSQLRERISHGLYHYALMYTGIIGVLFPALRNLLGGLWGGPFYQSAEIHQTTIYAWCLFGLLIVDGTGLIFRRLNIAMGDLRWQYYAMTIVQIGSAMLTPPIMRALGVNGAPAVIALNVFAALLAGLLLIVFRRPQYMAFFPAKTWKLVVTALLPLLVAWMMPHVFPWMDYSGEHTVTGKIIEMAKAGLMAGMGLGLVAVVSTLLKVEEADAVWRWLRNQLGAVLRWRAA